MPENLKVSLDGKEYIWDGSHWYDAQTYISPPLIVTRKLSARAGMDPQPKRVSILSTRWPPAFSRQSRKRRANWREFKRILTANRIITLYHFTDMANIPSIQSNGGLYSWWYCERNNIEIPRPGGSCLSRQLDFRKGLQDYVRLSFNRNQPMLAAKEKGGEIKKPVILEVNPSVIYWESTLFSNMNATDNSALVGGDLAALQSIRFDIVTKSSWMGEVEKKFYQAEAMVGTHVPLDLIKIPARM